MPVSEQRSVGGPAGPAPGKAAPAPRRTLGIREKLSVTISLVVILIILLTVLLVTFFERGANLERARQNADMLGNLVKIGMGEDIIRGNYRGLEYALKEFAQLAVVRYCVVLNPQGKILASTEPAQIGRFMTDGWTVQRLSMPDVAIRRSIHQGHPVSDACIPVRVGNGLFGMIRVGFSLQPAFDYLRTVLLGNLALGLCFIFVGILISIAVSGAILAPITSLMEAAEQVGRGDFAIQPEALATDEFGKLEATFQKMAVELHKKELMRKYVSPNAWTEVAGGTVEVARSGGRQEVAVLFSGIRRFSAFAERHQPDEVIDSLNRFFDTMVEAVARSGGIVDKFMGDRLMGVFLPAPGQRWPPEVRAVFAAFEMQRALGDFNLRQAALGLEEFQTGLGVNAGPVVIGQVGSTSRLEFTTLGETVNLAARLENDSRNAAAAGVFVTGGFLAKVRDFVQGSPAGNGNGAADLHILRRLTNLSFFLEELRRAPPAEAAHLIRLVSFVRTPEARRFLEETAQRGAPELAQEAIRALGTFILDRSEEAKAFLITLIRTGKDEILRSQAVSMLALAREPLLVGFFREVLGDPAGRVRANALQALLPLAFPEKAETFRALAGDKHHRVVANALLGLWLLDDPQVFPGLTELLASDDPARQTAGAYATATLAASRSFRAHFGRVPEALPATLILSHLARLVAGEDPAQRRLAVKALGQVGGTEAYDALGSLIEREKSPEVLAEAERALDRMRVRLGPRLAATGAGPGGDAPQPPTSPLAGD
ncbi:MAG: HAMP domain-containing protein [Candidatus Riflebacteria bacterium]|nr:HAMP domain-containing protein [Candidatus Riflebacteria bacterium]